MNSKYKRIQSPDQLDKHLKSTNPLTWISLIAVILALLGFFIWSFAATITFKITGIAKVEAGEILLNIQANRLKEIKIDQKVYILDQVGYVSSIKEDGQPVVSGFTLADQEYPFVLVVKQIHPIEYFSK